MPGTSVMSNVDLIRRFVFENQPVTVVQITAEIMRQMASVKSEAVARDKYVLPVLRSQAYYRETDGKWEILREKMPEYTVLEETMREQHRLLYEREVRSKVAAKLGVKVMNVVLDLEQAPQLKKSGAHWALKNWVVVNDQAAEVLAQHPGGLTEKDLVKHVCDRYQLDVDDAILNLKGDKKKRFVLDRKLWFLKTEYEKSEAAAREQASQLPERTGQAIDLLLEGSFLDAQAAKSTEEYAAPDSQAKARLKKTLRKQAQDILERREDLAPKPEDLAAKLSQVLTAAGVDEYGVKSFQRVETAPKEKGLSLKEREEIQHFIDQMMSQETVGVGAPLASVANAPLSARKMQDVLRLKYMNYARDRAVMPAEYCRLLVEVLRPMLNESVLHPACFEGVLAVELLSYLFDRLEGAAWALVDDDSNLEIVQPDGARYRLSERDPALIESAKDKFIVSQLDLINHFLSYNFVGIEADSVLARAARVVTRLTGYENVYIVSRDFLSELPEVFGLPSNDDNEIPMRFNCILGNYTFTQDANLAANYLDLSLGLVKRGGRVGVLVLQELLSLLKEHGLLGEFLQRMAVSHFIRLPLLEGRHNVILLVIQSLATDDAVVPPIITTEIRDFKSANALSHALQESPDDEDAPFRRIEQHALGALIG